MLKVYRNWKRFWQTVSERRIGTTFFFVSLLFLSGCLQESDPVGQKDGSREQQERSVMQALEGHWTAESSSKVELIFTASGTFKGKNQEESTEGKYLLDLSQKPWRITFVNVAQKRIQAIFELEGEKLFLESYTQEKPPRELGSEAVLYTKQLS